MEVKDDDMDIKLRSIEFNDFNGYWSLKDFTTPSLYNINAQFKQGKFYGIAGKVGSGKSGLLSCCLKEIPYYSGSLKINGKIAYVEQEPYISSGTVRDNIVFGSPFD